MKPASIALGLPHTPWIPERVNSFARLLDQLGIVDHEIDCDGSVALDQGRCRLPMAVNLWHARAFDEKASNKVWPLKMWRWGLETGADFFLTLQDDVEVADVFWPALRAMLTVLPRGATLGLSSVHPFALEVDRRGDRWYATRSENWGWAYGMWREDLASFVAWVDAHPDLLATLNEDDLICRWVVESGRTTWHPVPTIVDHDISIPSTYGNDKHANRRPRVTWRAYRAEELTRPEFWRMSQPPGVVEASSPGGCTFCPRGIAFAHSNETGAGICKMCLVCVTAASLGLTLAPMQPPGKADP